MVLKQGSRQIGFTGQTKFSILKQSTSLKRHDAELAAMLDERHDDLARIAKLLASFAFYSGIGIKTTQGMGLVRPNIH